MATVATIGTSTLNEVSRIKYLKSMLELSLRSALVSEKICQVDRTEAKFIANPYITAMTAAISSTLGTYALTTQATTDDTCTVQDQVSSASHLFEFEETLSRADLYSSFVQEMTNAVAVKVDQFVLNKVLDGATGAYTCPSGGFSSTNIVEIMSNLISKVAGFAEMYKGLFLVIENTEIPGFAAAQVNSGFSYADAALNNGFMGSFMGVDIYVVRSGVFVTTTLGSLTATNSGHRLFGVKGVATYAAPRGVQYDEKKVTLITGREIACWANIGAKVWTPKASLLVDVTI